jgi:CO/xanthine dehydrogenase FAD-binding subunit
MNASPAADTMPPLIAYGANCRSDRRVIAAEEICTGPGETCLAGNELLLSIELSIPPPGSLSFFHKLAPRDAMAIAIVGVAACLEVEEGRVLRARIALGAIAPTVIRARQAEAELLGKPLATASIARAATAAMAECKPIDDIRASADYRRRMVGRILEYQLSLAASPR